MKCYFFLPLFRLWLNVELNHSRSSPAVMSWEWSQDMVLTLEVPACTPSHLPLSPRRLIGASVLVPNSEWSLQKNWGCETHPSVKSSCVSHPDSLFPWEVCLFGSEDSSHPSECFCPTWKRSFFWLLPNPYFLSEPDSNHGCASMCRTRRYPGSESKGHLARMQKKQIWYPCSFSEGSSFEPVFVGSRILAILNSGSGSGRERRGLREKGVSIKGTCRPLHRQGEKGLQGHQAEQPYLGGCFKSLGKGFSSSWFSLQQKQSLAGQWVQILTQ